METDNVEVSLNIKVGTKFKDLQQFEEDLSRMCKSKFVQFYKKEARTIQSAIKKNITRYLNPDLKFYSIRWCCIHGGRKFQARGKGMRKTATLRKEDLCPAYIHVRIDESGNEFIVVSLNFKHNHIVAQELFKQLPHNRRLPDDIKADVKKLLNMKTNKNIIKEDLEKKLNQTVTLKDLRNLQQASKSSQNNIEVVSDLIKSKFGADCHVLIDENHVLEGLFFSSQEMIKSLIAYPEIIFIDTTFKALEVEAPVYIVLNVDGNGESGIVAISILINEETKSLQWFLETLKDSLPPETAAKITNIMTDKDFPERDILRSVFPEVNLHICVSHVLDIFRREITCEKFKITSNIKVAILELLQKLIHSKSEEIFFELIYQIKEKSDKIYDYLCDNWLDIKDEWCPFLGKKSKNFMNNCNNRLEGINVELKAVTNKQNSLEEFINELVIVRDSLEKEKKARISNFLNKRQTTVNKIDNFEYEYLKLLTPYAFDKLKTQFSYQHLPLFVAENLQFYNVKYKDYQLQTTPDSCTCYFHNSMGLPCKHIFAVRQHLDQNLFDTALVIDRWKMSYFMENCCFLHQDVEETNVNNVLFIDQMSVENNEKQTTSQDKYKKILIKTKLIATLARDLEEDKYRDVIAVLDAIINNLQDGKNDFIECAVSIINNNNDDNYKLIEEENQQNGVIDVIDEGVLTSMEYMNPDSPQVIFEIINKDISNEECDISQWSQETASQTESVNRHNFSKSQEKAVSTHNIISNDITELQTYDVEFDLKSIKVPLRKKSERTRGSDSTLTRAFKRQKKSNEQIPFSKKLTKEKIDILLKWIVKDLEVIKTRKIEIEDLLPCELMDIRILEMNTIILKKLFSVAAWALFKHYKQRIKVNAKWICHTCGNDIVPSDFTIRCDYCLHWQHQYCTDKHAQNMCSDCKL